MVGLESHPWHVSLGTHPSGANEPSSQRKACKVSYRKSKPVDGFSFWARLSGTRYFKKGVSEFTSQALKCSLILFSFRWALA